MTISIFCLGFDDVDFGAFQTSGACPQASVFGAQSCLRKNGCRG